MCTVHTKLEMCVCVWGCVCHYNPNELARHKMLGRVAVWGSSFRLSPS